MKLYPADNVAADGTVYPTVGEHIRKSHDSGNILAQLLLLLSDSTNKAKLGDALDVTGSELKTALVNLLTGNTAYFGGMDTDPLSEADKTAIKTYLGIS